MKKFTAFLLSVFCLLLIQVSAEESQPSEIENMIMVAEPPGTINMGKCPALKIPDTGKKIYSESFDNYSSGTLLKIIPDWNLLFYAAKNPGLWVVTNSEKASPPNSLKICGSRFECDGGNAEIILPRNMSGHILFKAKISGAGLSGEGCYKNDIGIDLRPLTSEKSTASVFIHSKTDTGIPDGLIFTSEKFTYYKRPIESYREAINKWISIAIEIDPITQLVHYWMDGVYQGFLVMQPEVVGKFVIFSGDGQGWIDDIEIIDLNSK